MSRAWQRPLGSTGLPVTAEQLLSNLAGAELTLDARSATELRGLGEPSDRYWSARSALRWN
jgi:hypothetical protein